MILPYFMVFLRCYRHLWRNYSMQYAFYKNRDIQLDQLLFLLNKNNLISLESTRAKVAFFDLQLNY